MQYKKYQSKSQESFQIRFNTKCQLGFAFRRNFDENAINLKNFSV